MAKLREEKGHLLLQVKAHKEDWEAEKNEKQEALKERDAVKQRLDSVLRDMCISSVSIFIYLFRKNSRAWAFTEKKGKNGKKIII